MTSTVVGTVTLTTLIMGVATIGLVACGGNSNDPTESRVMLHIADTKPQMTSANWTTSACLQHSDGEWSVGETGFTSEGTAINDRCVLIPAHLEQENETYWIAGPTFTVELRTPSFDDDDVPHSKSTAEDMIVEGLFSMSVFPRDEEDRELWSGELDVGPVDAIDSSGVILVMLRK